MKIKGNGGSIYVFLAALRISELVQLKLNIGTSVGDSTPTEARIRNPHL